MSVRLKTLLPIVLVTVYVTILAALVQFWVFPALETEMQATLWQIGSSLIMVAPILYVQPNLIKLFRARLKVVLLGLSIFLGTALVFTVLQDQSWTSVLHTIIRQSFTAPVEELLFRGYIWQKSLEFKNSLPFAIAINLFAFLAIHIPYFVAQAIPLHVFFYLVLGTLLFIYVRIKTKGLTLPSFVHAAINMIP